MSENSVEKRPIPMFWGQGEGERVRAEAPWTQSGLTLCLCKPLPLVGAFSQGFKMEIPAERSAQRGTGKDSGYDQAAIAEAVSTFPNRFAPSRINDQRWRSRFSI